VTFAQQNFICNELTYLVREKSATEFRLTVDSVVVPSKVWCQLITEQLLSPNFVESKRRKDYSSADLWSQFEFNTLQ